MSEHCFCMQTYWWALEGGQSEWGFEFGFWCNFLLVWVWWDLELLLEHCFMQDPFQYSLFMKSQNVGWQWAACFKEGVWYFLACVLISYFLSFAILFEQLIMQMPFFVSDGVQLIIGAANFWEGVFLAYRFFSLVGVIEIFYSYLSNVFRMQTCPHIRLYVVCKFSEGEWAAYERGFP